MTNSKASHYRDEEQHYNRSPQQEQVMHNIEVRQSLWILVGRYLLFFLIFTGIAGAWFMVREIVLTDLNYLIGLLCIHVFGFIVVLTFLLQWVAQRYVITPQKIVQMSGVIWQREKICAVRNIESVTLRQNILEKMFHYGTVKLYAPTHDQVIYLRKIPHPERYAAYIDAILPKTSGRNGGDNTVGSGVAVIRL